jgi:hypothetical protein
MLSSRYDLAYAIMALTNLIITQRLHIDIVAVSKPCCPVCWELLGILRGATDNFHVLGRHPIVFPVQLPSLLPRDIMEQMVARFKGFLHQEIIAMPPTFTEGHSRKHSGQSISGLSIASDNSASSTDEPGFPPRRPVVASGTAAPSGL